MLVNPIAAGKSAVNFNGKVRIDKFDKTYVFDTDNLPEVEHVKTELFDKAHYCIRQGDEFVKIGTEKIPVYEAKEPCLSYETGGDWSDLYISLPNGEKVCLCEDSNRNKYGQVHEVLERARQGKTAADGKPLSINV